MPKMFSHIVSLFIILVPPAISHPGHTSIPHIHNIAELSLLVIVIAFILYQVIKNRS